MVILTLDVAGSFTSDLPNRQYFLMLFSMFYMSRTPLVTILGVQISVLGLLSAAAAISKTNQQSQKQKRKQSNQQSAKSA